MTKKIHREYFIHLLGIKMVRKVMPTKTFMLWVIEGKVEVYKTYKFKIQETDKNPWIWESYAKLEVV